MTAVFLHACMHTSTNNICICKPNILAICIHAIMSCACIYAFETHACVVCYCFSLASEQEKNLSLYLNCTYAHLYIQCSCMRMCFDSSCGAGAFVTTSIPSYSTEHKQLFCWFGIGDPPLQRHPFSGLLHSADFHDLSSIMRLELVA